MNNLPAPGPDVPPQTVDIDAKPGWGFYRITFVAKRSAEQGVRPYWFWAAEAGKRLLLRTAACTLLTTFRGEHA